MTPDDGPRKRALDRLHDLSRAETGSMIYNAGSLFGGTLLTAALGAVYWALAARVFSPEAVGIAAAAISATLLAGQVATVGLGTVLMGELRHHPGSERSLIYSGVGAAALIGLGLGVAVIVVAGVFIPELAEMRDLPGLLLFGAGAAVTAAGLVLDQAFLGLLRGGLQLVRNVVASVSKLAVLAAVGFTMAVALQGETLLMTWVAGGIVSMLLLLVVQTVTRPGSRWTVWQSPGRLPELAIRHHLLNFSILAPGLVLPLVITAVVSAEANAYFYIAFLIAGFAFAVPSALTTAVYAAGSRDLAALPSRVRFAFWVSVAAGVALNAFMLVGAAPVLAIFGSAYAENAVTLLRLFSLGIFFVIINSLFVPIARVERRFLEGALLMLANMAIEFTFVVAGALLVIWKAPAGAGSWGTRSGSCRSSRLSTASESGARSNELTPTCSGSCLRRSSRDRKPVPPTEREAGAHGRSSSRPRTFAVATDGPFLERWQAACIAAMFDAGFPVGAWIHRSARRSWPSAKAAALERVPVAERPRGLPEPVAIDKGGEVPFDVDVLLDLTRQGIQPGERRGTSATWAYDFGREASQESPWVRRCGRSCAGRGRSVSGSERGPKAVSSARGQSARRRVRSRGSSTGCCSSPPRGRGRPRPIRSSGLRIRLLRTAEIPPRPARARPVLMLLLRVGVAAREVLTSATAVLRHSDWAISFPSPDRGWLDRDEPPTVSWLPDRPGR